MGRGCGCVFPGIYWGGVLRAGIDYVEGMFFRIYDHYAGWMDG